MTTPFNLYNRIHADLNDEVESLAYSKRMAIQNRPYDWYSRQELRDIRTRQAAYSIYHDLLCEGAA